MSLAGYDWVSCCYLYRLIMCRGRGREGGEMVNVERVAMYNFGHIRFRRNFQIIFDIQVVF